MENQASTFNANFGDSGFSLPNFGGTVGTLILVVNHDDTSSASIELPDNIIPVGMLISITEDFDAGTDNLLDVGYTGALTYFGDDIDVGTQANLREDATNVDFVWGVPMQNEGVSLIASYAESGTAATQGQLYIIFNYMIAGETTLVE